MRFRSLATAALTICLLAAAGCESSNEAEKSDLSTEDLQSIEHPILATINATRDFTSPGDFYRAKDIYLLDTPDPALEPLSWSKDLAAIAREWASQCKPSPPDPDKPPSLEDSYADIQGYPSIVTVMHDLPANWSIEVTPKWRANFEKQYQEALNGRDALEAARTPENSEELDALLKEDLKKPTDEDISQFLRKRSTRYIVSKWEAMSQMIGFVRRTKDTPPLPQGRPPRPGDCFSEIHSSLLGCREWRILLHRGITEVGCARVACRPNRSDPAILGYSYEDEAVYTPMACIFSPRVEVASGAPY